MNLDENSTLKAFNTELNELLKKYDAELYLDETHRSYCGSTYEIAVTIEGRWQDGECIREFVDARLGGRICAK